MANLELLERLKAGDTDDQIIKYLVDRYGEFVLLRPSLGAHTLLLWGLPFVLLLGGALLIFIRRGRQQRQPAEQGLTSEDQERIKQLLD